MYFSATIFALVGFSSPTLASLSVAITNFVFTVVAFGAIDGIGRRRILLYSVPAMVLGLALAAVGFELISLPAASDSPVAGAEDSGEDSIRASGKGKSWAMTILCAMVIYVAGYAVGLGCVPWQQSE